MIQSFLVDDSNRALHYVPSTIDFEKHGNILITETQATAHAVFKAVTIATASTETIVGPIPGGSLQVTGFLVSFGKDQGNTTTITFTDGSNSEDLVVQDQDTADINDLKLVIRGAPPLLLTGGGVNDNIVSEVASVKQLGFVGYCIGRNIFKAKLPSEMAHALTDALVN